jgi:hypothetical protein
MDAFSYISIVPSIIIALGLARLLTGIGKILERRDKVQNYWVHILCAFQPVSVYGFELVGSL